MFLVFDGTAAVAGFGGEPGYTYLWDNGENTFIATALDAGTHFVTITDDNGCNAICSVDISEPTQLTCDINIDATESCVDEFDGQLSAVATGGTPSYTYLWSNGSTTSTISGLTGGNYSVTITDSQSCISICNVTLPTEPDTTPPLIACAADAIVSCGSPYDISITGDVNIIFDNCDTAAEMNNTHVDDVNLYLCNGNTGYVERTFTVTDVAGNAATCVQNILIEDNEGPEITVEAMDQLLMIAVIPAHQKQVSPSKILLNLMLTQILKILISPAML